MNLPEQLRKRLSSEYVYAAGRMQQVQDPSRRLFYFSVFFGEAARVLNLQWDRDLALIHTVTQCTHTNFLGFLQTGIHSIPVDLVQVMNQLTSAASDLASWMEGPAKTRQDRELYVLLGRLSELSYAVTGNGGYLYERGLIKPQASPGASTDSFARGSTMARLPAAAGVPGKSRTIRGQ